MGVDDHAMKLYVNINGEHLGLLIRRLQPNSGFTVQCADEVQFKHHVRSAQYYKKHVDFSSEVTVLTRPARLTLRLLRE